MAFLWRHGQWALRDCDDCRRFVYHEGEVYRDGDGNPLPNPCPPRCEDQPCGGRDKKPRLAQWMLGLLALWRACRTYHALPRARGICDQDEYLMECFLALDGLRAEIDAEELAELTRTK